MKEDVDPLDWLVAGPLAVRATGAVVGLEGRDLDLTPAQASMLAAL